MFWGLQNSLTWWLSDPCTPLMNYLFEQCFLMLISLIFAATVESNEARITADLDTGFPGQSSEFRSSSGLRVAHIGE